MAKHRSATHRHSVAAHPTELISTSGITPRTQLGLERVLFFSDAVIAIAITLLALEIRLPDQASTGSNLAAELLALTPQYVSFIISFFVIGLFWMSHHRMFEYIATYNHTMMWINLIFLFLVAFIPFPTAVLGRFLVFTSVAFYAAVMVCLSLVRIWFWWYVYYRAHLVRPDTDPRAGPYEFRRAIMTAAVFGISIVIAIWSPGLAMLFWIILIPVSILIRLPD